MYQNFNNRESTLLVPCQITVPYLIVGGFLSGFSSHVLQAMVTDPLLASKLQTISNLLLFLVLIAAAVLHLVICRGVDRVKWSEEEVRKQIENQRVIQADAETSMRDFYKNTILAVTGDKLNLVDYDEISARLGRDTQVLNLAGSAELDTIRAVTEEALRRLGVSSERTDMFLIAVAEAVGNAVVHGGGGVVRLATRDGRVQICVQDDGPGIETFILPKATLMMGFSTRPSMGLGYTMIVQSVDVVFLATSCKGTWVLMEMGPVISSDWDNYSLSIPAEAANSRPYSENRNVTQIAASQSA